MHSTVSAGRAISYQNGGREGLPALLLAAINAHWYGVEAV
jgi:hypothetical protein